MTDNDEVEARQYSNLLAVYYSYLIGLLDRNDLAVVAICLLPCRELVEKGKVIRANYREDQSRPFVVGCSHFEQHRVSESLCGLTSKRRECAGGLLVIINMRPVFRRPQPLACFSRPADVYRV